LKGIENMTYKKLFDKATYEKVNKENLNLLQDYELELKSNGKSVKTVYQYGADIRAFFCWIYENQDNKYILDLKKRTFRQFFLGMIDNGTSPARVNRFQSSIRNLLEFASMDDDEYDYDINAMRAIKGMTNEKVREIVFLTDEQVTMLIDYLMDKEDYIKALYVSLSYDSAGRRNEINQVLKDGFTEKSQTNEVIGKRAKKFKLIYFDRTREIAKKYLEQRGNDDFKELFVSGLGDEKRVVSYETMYNWVVSFRKILLELTGEEIALNPHSFRHSALEAYSQGTHHALKEMGKDSLGLNVVKVIAHHNDISTTANYLMNHDDDLLESELGITLD